MFLVVGIVRGEVLSIWVCYFLRNILIIYENRIRGGGGGGAVVKRLGVFEYFFRVGEELVIN